MPLGNVERTLSVLHRLEKSLLESFPWSRA